MGAYKCHQWNKVLPYINKLLEDIRPRPLAFHQEAMALAKHERIAAHHAADASAKQIATAIALRKYAWLRSATIPDDARMSIEDLPFDGSGLFDGKSDDILGELQKNALLVPTATSSPTTLTNHTGENHILTSLFYHNLIKGVFTNNCKRPPTKASPFVKKHVSHSVFPTRERNNYDCILYPSLQRHCTGLSPFLPAWTTITTDTWVLSIVATGYAIEFTSPPPTRFFHSTSPTTELVAEI